MSAPYGGRVGEGCAPLRLPLRGGGSAVMVSARGLWDRWAAPHSADAAIRAYQRTVPCCVRIRAEADPPAHGLSLAELEGVLERSLAYAEPVLAVPFLIELRDPSLLPPLSALCERVPGCKLVARWPEVSRFGLSPVVETRLDSPAAPAPWAWRLPIETAVDPVLGPALPQNVRELRPRRLVVDSVDVLTVIADARAWPPSREDALLDGLQRIDGEVRDASPVSETPSGRAEIEVWRVSDLLEGEFLAHFTSLPLSG